MPHARSTGPGNRSGSMILQPEDIVPQTAEEAIACIENAVHAVVGANRCNLSACEFTSTPPGQRQPDFRRVARTHQSAGLAVLHRAHQVRGPCVRSDDDHPAAKLQGASARTS